MISFLYPPKRLFIYSYVMLSVTIVRYGHCIVILANDLLLHSQKLTTHIIQNMKSKYNVVYYIMYFKYIFFNKMSGEKLCKKIKVKYLRTE
jgi:hypothetical protein